MNNKTITYGSEHGSRYLNIKSSGQAQEIFNRFVTAVLGSDWRDSDNDVSTEYQKIKSALEKYHAVYRFENARSGYVRKHFIRFDNPADLTAFLLRYA